MECEQIREKSANKWTTAPNCCWNRKTERNVMFWKRILFTHIFDFIPPSRIILIARFDSSHQFRLVWTIFSMCYAQLHDFGIVSIYTVSSRGKCSHNCNLTHNFEKFDFVHKTIVCACEYRPKIAYVITFDSTVETIEFIASVTTFSPQL